MLFTAEEGGNPHRPPLSKEETLQKGSSQFIPIIRDELAENDPNAAPTLPLNEGVLKLEQVFCNSMYRLCAFKTFPF